MTILNAPREPGQKFRSATHVTRRPNDGFVIEQGRGRVLLTRTETWALIDLLIDKLNEQPCDGDVQAWLSARRSEWLEMEARTGIETQAAQQQ